MKQTHDDLVAEIAKLKQSHEGWVSGDERRRKEFAKAFDWYKQRYVNPEGEPLLPSWEQIFTEVGKLLAAKSFMDFGGKISELECAVEDLKKKLSADGN